MNTENSARMKALRAAYAFRELGRRWKLGPSFALFQCRRCSMAIQVESPLSEGSFRLLEQHSSRPHFVQLGLTTERR